MASCCESDDGCNATIAVKKEKLGLWSDKFFISLVCASLVAVALEIAHWVGFEANQKILLFVAIGYFIVFGREVFTKGFKDLIKFRFSDINVLMTVAAVAALLLGEYLEAMVVISLFALGETMEGKGIESSRAELLNLLNKTPKKAELKNGTEIALDDLKVGEIIVVRTGSLIPVDGEIIAGSGVADESSMTGESIPKAKLLGHKVFAGTLLVNGFIEVKAEKDAKNSTLAKIIAITFEAAKEKAKIQKFIEKFAAYYTPAAMAAAFLVFIIPTVFLGGNIRHWLEQALTLLVISCPCSLVISTPLAIYTAVGEAAKKGIVIKGGRILEALSKINRIAFDKTRTLTIGKPQVVNVATLSSMKPDEVLACAAGIEKYSEHPLAKGIVDAAIDRGLKAHDVSDYHSVLGKGAQAKCLICSDEEHFIGSQTFALEKLTLSEKEKDTINAFEREGKTSIVLWNKNNLEGVLAMEDTLKTEAKEVLQKLHAMGIKTTMLTGDHELAAASIATKIGLTDFHASLLPTDKADRIKTFERAGDYVAMVGDGVNDAPALASASVGIAMGAAGSDAAIEVAGVALLNDKLSSIPYLIKLSRRSWNIIRFNTFLAVSTKAFALLLAVLGVSSLSIAILADVGITILVILITISGIKSIR